MNPEIIEAAKAELPKAKAEADAREEESSAAASSVQVKTAEALVAEHEETSEPVIKDEPMPSPVPPEVSSPAAVPADKTAAAAAAASVGKAARAAVRKSYGAANIASPLLKEPFKDGMQLYSFSFCSSVLMNLLSAGWRREVVFRAIVDPGTKTMCDVYYYTPDNKKLRSGREVAEYCEYRSTSAKANPE